MPIGDQHSGRMGPAHRHASGWVSVNGQDLGLQVSIKDTDRGWCVSLQKSRVHGKLADRRIVRVVENLVELDVIAAQAIQRGRAVSRQVQRLPPGHFAERRGSVFRFGDIARPLLSNEPITDSLYPYQRFGVAWLLRNPRALLADDMGLGKTAQVLAAVRRLVHSGRIGWAVVVAPRTLLDNWVEEAHRWAPELCVLVALPNSRTRTRQWARYVRRAHIVITSYEQVRDPPPALIHTPPDLMVADEAHRLRRRKSRSSQGFRRIKCDRIWALSGTPVERDAEDLAVIMSIVEPRRFSHEDRLLHPTVLRSRSRRYMLRRSKAQVLRDLPPVVEHFEKIELSREQMAAYQLALSQSRLRKAKGEHLKLFGKLRLICDLDPHSLSSSKLDRIEELLEEIAAMKEKAVVFSYILAPLRELSRRLDRLNTVGYRTLSGSQSLADRSEVVSRFKTDADCDALLVSTRVGAEGLTLVEANHVIFVNRWWNPSANVQARDRVVRIGQLQTVFVWTFECTDTVECRLSDILRRKERTFDDLIDAIRRTSRRNTCVRCLGRLRESR